MTGRLVWTASEPLLLASTSATRRGLLERAGIPVEVEAPGVDERAIESHLGPAVEAGELALRLAREKAAAVARRHSGRLVIGADQVLHCEGRLFGKPACQDGAREQLAALAGRSHTLHSAVVLVRSSDVEAEFVATARLTMRSLDEEAIATYVAAAGPAAIRSAGGYEIEGLGIHLFDTVEGEHSTILGLPLLSTLAALRRLGCLAL